MKHNRLFGLALIFCALFLSFGPIHAQQYSPQFQALLNQIQQNYLAQKGDNLSSLRNRFPTVVATLIGHVLRQQTVYVQQNSSLNNQFTSLQREARAYIGEVARTTTVRLVDGSPFNPEDLWSMVNKALQGGDDGWILETFGVRTGTMPSVLASSHRPQQPGRPLGGIPEGTEEKNQIELLGKVAPSVKGPPMETPPPPPRQITLKPDGIQGIWYSRDSAQLKVWKEGDTYLGMVNNQGTIGENWPRNQICFRLKYAGQGDDGRPDWRKSLVFKGKHNTPGNSQLYHRYEWKDKTSYYVVESSGVESFGPYRYAIFEERFTRNPR